MKNVSKCLLVFSAVVLFVVGLSCPLFAQDALREKVRAIATHAKGKVSAACGLEGSALNCDLNAHGHPPMQSVFKFPLAVTALHQIETGKLSLDQKLRFLASDRIPHTHSPLQNKYPNGEVNIPLNELLRLSISESDNVATDIVLRGVGGPPVVNDYIASLRVRGFHMEDGEDGLHRDVKAQYRNWVEPAGAVQLLQRIGDANSPLTPEHTRLLLGWMENASAGRDRIRGGLPAGTVVAHKTGSSGTVGGVTFATNDIALITLPDGRKLAVAVFVSDSRADEATLDVVIARIAKAAYDEAVAANNPK
ncbi:MAG: class A beta-lactamase [Candidatus Acidiferrales bacterium]